MSSGVRVSGYPGYISAIQAFMCAYTSACACVCVCVQVWVYVREGQGIT
jgi:hypothetical protein